MFFQNQIKPIFDIIIALIMTFFLLPLGLFLYFLIKSRGFKPLFVQKRTGKNKKVFNLYKFRTMPEAKSNTLPSWALWLRRYSLDEIPQLINVLKGELSLVGPRPLLVEYLPFYNRSQDTRHTVKPGITGWAQINGRNGLSWEEKFKKDTWYAESICLLLDIKILFITIMKLITPENVIENGLSDKEKFSHTILVQPEGGNWNH